MVIKEKSIYVGKKLCNGALKKEGTDYIVEVDGTVYKKTTNELFAVQAFNEIYGKRGKLIWQMN